jgi:DNA-binding transcriptional MocR family regulator
MARTSAPNTHQPLYIKVARQIEGQIRKGALAVGDKVPSIRGLRRQQRVSVSTVIQAYLWLENKGWIESRPQSGFYVRTPYAELIPEPEGQSVRCVPTEVGVTNLLNEVVGAIADPSMIPFGAACASPEFYPNRKLNQTIHRIMLRKPAHSSRYDLPTGSEPLRRQIARRSTTYGCSFSPREILITCGAMEALNLGLRAVAKPGDVVAIECPTYWGILQMIQSLEMKAIEIPTHPRTGMDLDALSTAIKKHRVRICIGMTNCHNPLGFVTDDNYKRDLVSLLARHNVPLIEEDIYADLTFDGIRPTAAKTFDSEGIVMLCSSFSKVLAPGFRVGWIQAGRFQEEVERQKFVASIASPSLPQLAIAEFLETGGYDRYLRGLRGALSEQMKRTSQAIATHFPEGTKLSRPAGGYVLWVELPKNIDALKLYRAALARNISVLPGPICSPTGQFRNHIRINCGQTWSERIEQAIATLGKLCLEVQRR